MDTGPNMWEQIQIGYLRKKGEDWASTSNSSQNANGSLPVLIGMVGAWIVGSTLFGFYAGEPAPFLVFDALLILAMVGSQRKS